MKGHAIAMALVGALAAGQAHAITSTSQSLSFSGTASDIASLDFDRFDASLGDLQAVTISLSGDFDTFLSALPSADGTFTADGTVIDVELELTGLPGDRASFLAADGGFARDGTFTGSKYTPVRIGDAFTESLSASFSAATPGDYAGAGTFEVLLSTGSGTVGGSCPGCGLGWDLDASGDVTVKYDYVAAIPLPAGAWMLLSGLGLWAGGGRAMRKRHETDGAAATCRRRRREGLSARRPA